MVQDEGSKVYSTGERKYPNGKQIHTRLIWTKWLILNIQCYAT